MYFNTFCFPRVLHINICLKVQVYSIIILPAVLRVRNLVSLPKVKRKRLFVIRVQRRKYGHKMESVMTFLTTVGAKTLLCVVRYWVVKVSEKVSASIFRVDNILSQISTIIGNIYCTSFNPVHIRIDHASKQMFIYIYIYIYIYTYIYKEPTWCNLAVRLLVTAIILYMFRTLFCVHPQEHLKTVVTASDVWH